MPFYEYHCPACQEEFEEIRALVDRDEPARCPKCGSEKPQRRISLVASCGSSGAGASSCSSPGGFS